MYLLFLCAKLKRRGNHFMIVTSHICQHRSAQCRMMLNYNTFLESLHVNTEVNNPALSPGSALSRQEVKKSAVKWMSTSQKKSRTFWLRLQALAPTYKPRPRENSSFSWIRVKLLNRVSLRERRQKSVGGFDASDCLHLKCYL